MRKRFLRAGMFGLAAALLMEVPALSTQGLEGVMAGSMTCLAEEASSPAAGDAGQGADDAGLSYEDRKNWHRGKWVDGSYVNDQGVVMASLAQANLEPIPKIAGIKKKKILFIGSSRTEQISRSVRDDEVLFYGCGTSGFRWFFQRLTTGSKAEKREPAYQVIRAFLRAHPKGPVIIDMGGNDVHNLEAYLGFYRDLLNQYPAAVIWFQGILPKAVVNEERDRRREFNLLLGNAFPGHVINLYDQVRAFPDFSTTDGTHYPDRLNRRIYQMIMDTIGRKVTVNMKNGKVAASGKKTSAGKNKKKTGTKKKKTGKKKK